MEDYNHRRPHESLNNQTLEEVTIQVFKNENPLKEAV